MADDEKKDELSQTQGDHDPKPQESADDTLGQEPGGAAGEVPSGMGPFERARTERDERDDRLAASAEADTPDPVARDPEPSAPSISRAAEHRGESGGGGGGGRGFIAGLLASLLVLALAAAAGYVTRDLWAPPMAETLAQHLPQHPGRDEEPAQVTEAISGLKTETSALRSELAASEDRLTTLQQEVDGLRQEVEQAVASMEAPVQTGASSSAGAPASEEAGATGDGATHMAMAAPQAAQPDFSKPLGDIDQRLVQLEEESERLDAVEEQLDTLQSSVSQLRSADAQASEQSRRPVATVLAVNQLAEALGRSDGYVQQLETLRAIAGDDAALSEPLDNLEQWARTGVATFGELQARFPEVAQAVAQSDYQREGDSWIDSVTNRLTSLVTVRQVGDAALASGGIDAVLAEAETALQANDLSGAVKAVERLEGQAAEAAASWLKQAQDRLAAEQALADLRTVAIAQLNAAKG